MVDNTGGFKTSTFMFRWIFLTGPKIYDIGRQDWPNWLD